MKLSQQRTRPRRGFTLIELLVVISIIAVLVGLIVPAIFNALRVGPRVIVANEIGQLDLAIQAFKLEYKVKHIPSQIKLCEQFSGYNMANPLDSDSVSYLMSLWPHMQSNWAGLGIDWNGDRVISTTPVVLEGDQCLVFFLGGIPVGTTGATIGTRSGPPGCYGFSSDTKDPVKLNQGQGRKGPFYTDFKSDRLALRYDFTAAQGTSGGASGFYSFYDSHGTADTSRDKPFAYFSNYGIRNGYNSPINLKPGYGNAGDCPSIQNPVTGTPPAGTVALVPYYESQTPVRFHNSEGHQIISAGADHLFGPGALWTPKLAEGYNVVGRDDQTNFYRQLMGVGN